jgi:hypothetical protein
MSHSLGDLWVGTDPSRGLGAFSFSGGRKDIVGWKVWPALKISISGVMRGMVYDFSAPVPLAYP